MSKSILFSFLFFLPAICILSVAFAADLREDVISAGDQKVMVYCFDSDKKKDIHTAGLGVAGIGTRNPKDMPDGHIVRDLGDNAYTAYDPRSRLRATATFFGFFVKVDSSTPKQEGSEEKPRTIPAAIHEVVCEKKEAEFKDEKGKTLTLSQLMDIQNADAFRYNKLYGENINALLVKKKVDCLTEVDDTGEATLSITNSEPGFSEDYVGQGEPADFGLDEITRTASFCKKAEAQDSQ